MRNSLPLLIFLAFCLGVQVGKLDNKYGYDLGLKIGQWTRNLFLKE